MYCILVWSVGSLDKLSVEFHFISTNFAHVAAPSTGDENVRGTVCISTPWGPDTPSSESVTELDGLTTGTCIPG